MKGNTDVRAIARSCTEILEKRASSDKTETNTVYSTHQILTHLVNRDQGVVYVNHQCGLLTTVANLFFCKYNDNNI
jgi:hypothetical protein